MKTPEQIQTDLQGMMTAARQTHTYKLEGAIMEFTEDMVKLLHQRGLTKTALAERINSSPAYVTKIMRGTSNFTLDSMVKIATALDAEFRCHLQARGTQTMWVDYPLAQPRPVALPLTIQSTLSRAEFSDIPPPPLEASEYETIPLAA